MSIINFLFGETRNDVKMPPPSDDFWYKTVGSATSNYVSPETAMTVTAVYTCVRILSESVSSLPLHVYRRKEGQNRERDPKHYLSKLVKRPNVWMNKVDFWEFMISSVAMRGNAYARKIFANNGQILQLIPLDSSRMIVEQLSDGRLEYIYRLRNGTSVKYPQSDMFHIRGLPLDGVVGISPLSALQRTLNYQMELQRYGNAFFENNAQPGGILMHPGHLSTDARDNLKKSIDENYSKSNIGKTMVLEEGLKYERPVISHADLEFIDIQKLNKSDVYAAYRMPPHMAGDLDKATFSNIEHQSLEFVQFTLTPWLVRTEEAIWRDLVSDKEKDSIFAEFLVMGLLRGDQKARYEAYAVGLNNGFLNPDEVRSYENLNEIPDGTGKIYRVPLNMAPADQAYSDEKQQENDGVAPGTPTAAGSNEPMEGRSQIIKAFRSLFSDTYGRIIRREQKVAPEKRTNTWESEHQVFVSESFKTLFENLVDLVQVRDSKRADELKVLLPKLAATKDFELRNKYVPADGKYQEYLINNLWAEVQQQLNNEGKA